MPTTETEGRGYNPPDPSTLTPEEVSAVLADLRASIDREEISYGEIAYLVDFGERGLIPDDDMTLRQWADIPEGVTNYDLTEGAFQPPGPFGAITLWGHRAYRADICVDCLSFLANGEVWGADGEDIAAAHSTRMDLALGDGVDLTLGHLAGHCEWCRAAYLDGGESSCDSGGFSWSRCDGCGSALGGDRYPATLWIPLETETEGEGPDQTEGGQ